MTKTKRNHDHNTCFKCNETGHYSNECPKATKADDEKQFLTNVNDDNDDDDYDDDDDDEEDDNNNCNFANNLCKQSPSDVSKHWILLDNQSTLDVFQNRDLLTIVRDTGKQTRIHCNASITTTTLMGDLPGYGKV